MVDLNPERGKTKKRIKRIIRYLMIPFYVVVLPIRLPVLIYQKKLPFPRVAKSNLAILLLSAIVTVTFVSIFQPRPSKDFLTALVQALVQFLAFGGIIVAFVLPSQRAYIREIRKDLDSSDAALRDWKSKHTKHTDLEYWVFEVRKKLKKAQEDYRDIQVYFFISFLFLGADLLVSLLNLASVDYVPVSLLNVVTYFIAFEILLLIEGVLTLLSALFVGATLTKSRT